MFLHRGGGQVSVVEVAAVRPGGGVGEEVPLAAPAGDVELGLGEAPQSASAGVVDRGAVLVELAGELADRGRDWFQGAVLAQPGGEAGDHVRRAARFSAADLIAGEPGGDHRVGIAVPAVQHDVGDGDAEGGDRRKLPALPQRGAGGRPGAGVACRPAGGLCGGAEFAYDRADHGRRDCRPVPGGDGRACHRVDVVEVLLQAGCFRWLVSAGEEPRGEGVDVLLGA